MFRISSTMDSTEDAINNIRLYGIEYALKYHIIPEDLWDAIAKDGYAESANEKGIRKKHIEFYQSRIRKVEQASSNTEELGNLQDFAINVDKVRKQTAVDIDQAIDAIYATDDLRYAIRNVYIPRALWNRINEEEFSSTVEESYVTKSDVRTFQSWFLRREVINPSKLPPSSIEESEIQTARQHIYDNGIRWSVRNTYIPCSLWQAISENQYSLFLDEYYISIEEIKHCQEIYQQYVSSSTTPT